MSERADSPRLGGRDADGRRSDARGARHYTGGTDARAERSDTRRSGTGRDQRETRRQTGETAVPRARVQDADDSVRPERRASDAGRADRRPGSDPARGRGRRPEPMIGKGRSTMDRESARKRDTGPVEGRKRNADPVEGRKRDTGPVESRKRDTGPVPGRKRDTGEADVRKRDGGPVEGRKRDLGVLAERGMGKAMAGGRRRDARAGGRRPVVDAPVDGTAALKPEAVIELDVAEAEPLRITPPARNTGEVDTPRLRVAPPAPVSAPRAPFVGAVIGVVIIGVLGILLINTKTNENSFRIADLQKQDAVLDNQEQDLDNQLVAVSSIGNLDAAARRLGLVKAENPALLTLPDGKILGVPTPASGKPAVTAQDAKTAGPDKTDDAGAGKVTPAGGQQTAGADGGGAQGIGTASNGNSADGSQMNTGTTSGTNGAGH
jgi:hypothetical protein